MERRQGLLTGQQNASCTVVISKIYGVECSRFITDVSPRPTDGEYKLRVDGESATSRWRRDKHGWTLLCKP
jgi:hypothetical protein